MTQLGRAALAYARRGWLVFPLHGVVNGACTCGRRDCSSPGKHPLVRRGVREATDEARKIRDWWRRWRSANVAIATGTESGIAVIDIDLGHRPNTSFGSAGEERQDQRRDVWDSLDCLIERLPRTLTGLTGGGGIHLVYGTRELRLGNSAGRLPGIDDDLPGIDLRANGGYIVAPPSIHVSGRNYEWLEEHREVAPAPAWLKEPERRHEHPAVAVPARCDGDGSAYGLAVLRDEMDRVRSAKVGMRNDQLNRSAFALAQLVAGGELLENRTCSALLAAALAVGLGEHEAYQTLNSGFRAGLRRPRCAPHRR